MNYGQPYPPPQSPVPYYQPPQQARQPANNWLVYVLLFVIGVLLWRGGYFEKAIDNFDRQPDVIVNPDDNRQDQNIPPSNLKDAWLVIIEETRSRPADRQILLDSIDARLPSWKQATGLAGKGRYDPDSNKAKNFVGRAAADGINAPFVMLIDASGKMLSVIPFPDSIAEIERLLK